MKKHINPALKQAGAGGARPDTNAPNKKRAILCDNRHIRALRHELRRNGLSLKGTTGKTQRQVLVRVLQYLGERGLNTIEANGLGYYRIATRIQELEELGFIISSLREPVIGDEGLSHVGVARYVLREGHAENVQLPLDLGRA